MQQIFVDLFSTWDQLLLNISFTPRMHCWLLLHLKKCSVGSIWALCAHRIINTTVDCIQQIQTTIYIQHKKSNKLQIPSHCQMMRMVMSKMQNYKSQMQITNYKFIVIIRRQGWCRWYQCKIVVVALSTCGSWRAAWSAALLIINQTIIIIIIVLIATLILIIIILIIIINVASFIIILITLTTMGDTLNLSCKSISTYDEEI